jgi:hypothetical protein
VLSPLRSTFSGLYRTARNQDDLLQTFATSKNVAESVSPLSTPSGIVAEASYCCPIEVNPSAAEEFDRLVQQSIKRDKRPISGMEPFPTYPPMLSLCSHQLQVSLLSYQNLGTHNFVLRNCQRWSTEQAVTNQITSGTAIGYLPLQT